MKKLSIIFALVCLLSNQVMAECEPSVAKNYPGIVPPNYYGNSQTDGFNCAISGTNDLSTLQQRERAALLPPKLNDRFYLRFGLNAASETVASLKNKSEQPSILNSVVSTNRFKAASNNIELAAGYVWTDFAIDLEWLGVKSISFNTSLRGTTGSAIPFSGKVKGDATLANIYWIFHDLYNFKFYGVGVVGFTNNRCSAQLPNGQLFTINKKYAASYGAGLGMRFNVVSSLYADMSARYIMLGGVKFVASNTVNFITVKGSRNWMGLSVRVLWLI